MICCDTCPYSPTCEDVADWLRDVLGVDDYDEDQADEHTQRKD
jgi:disulfide oxidoreductase YuzD